MDCLPVLKSKAECGACIAKGNDVIFLSKFDVSNTDNVSVNINGIGIKDVKKPSINGLIDLLPNDILPENTYTLSYDQGNDCFQFYKNG